MQWSRIIASHTARQNSNATAFVYCHLMTHTPIAKLQLWVWPITAVPWLSKDRQKSTRLELSLSFNLGTVQQSQLACKPVDSINLSVTNWPTSFPTQILRDLILEVLVTLKTHCLLVC